METASNLAKNKASSLLSREHNEQIFQILGHRCKSLATTLVHMRVSDSRSNLTWTRKDEDVLCLIKDYSMRNFYFRLYSLKNNCLIWERKITDVHYIGLPYIFSVLETKNYLFNFIFTSEQEAVEMKNIAEGKLLKGRQPPEAKPKLKQNNLIDAELNKKSKTGKPSAKKKPKAISKLDIGVPRAFQHLNSVSWDPNVGFNIEGPDPHLSNFFGNSLSENERHLQKTSTVVDYLKDYVIKLPDESSTEPIPDVINILGGPDEFLKSQHGEIANRMQTDEQTRQFIYDFINKHDDVKDDPKRSYRKKLLPPSKPPPPPPKRVTSVLPPEAEIPTPNAEASQDLTPHVAEHLDNVDGSKIDIDRSKLHDILMKGEIAYKETEDESTGELIMNFMTGHSDQNKSVAADSRNSLPLKPKPPPKPPKPIVKMLSLSTSSTQITNENIDTGQLMVDSDQENNNLVKFLTKALARRKQILYSDDSGES